MSGHQQAGRDDWGQQFELATAQFYTAVVMAGDTAIDGGANAGMHTIPLAHLVGATGRVIACEPQPACLADLARRLAYEGLAERVVLCQGVLAAQSGTATFWRHPTDSALSSRVPPQDVAHGWLPCSVPSLQIDAIAPGARVALIKLDLEGGEFDALRGACRTLREDRPIVLFENGGAYPASRYGYSEKDFFDLFANLDYMVYDYFGVPLTRPAWREQFVFPWYFIAGHRHDRRLGRIVRRARAFGAALTPNTAAIHDWGEVTIRIGCIAGVSAAARRSFPRRLAGAAMRSCRWLARRVKP